MHDIGCFLTRNAAQQVYPDVLLLIARFLQMNHRIQQFFILHLAAGFFLQLKVGGFKTESNGFKSGFLENFT